MFSVITSGVAAVLHAAIALRFFWHAVLNPKPASSIGTLVCMTMPVGWLVVLFQEFNTHDVRLVFPSLLTVLAFWMGAIPLAVLVRLDMVKPYPFR